MRREVGGEMGRGVRAVLYADDRLICQIQRAQLRLLCKNTASKLISPSYNSQDSYPRKYYDHIDTCQTHHSSAKVQPAQRVRSPSLVE